MAQFNQFAIRNDLSSILLLNIEPEGAFFPLETGEEVSVIDEFTRIPVTLKLTTSDQGVPIITVWPGDGEVRIEKGGVDVLDLLQQAAGV